MQKKKEIIIRGGPGRGLGGGRLAGQGGCERRIEVIMKIKKKTG